MNAGNFQRNINKGFQHDLVKQERKNLGRIRRNLCTFFILLFTRNLFEEGFYGEIFGELDVALTLEVTKDFFKKLLRAITAPG